MAASHSSPFCLCTPFITFRGGPPLIFYLLRDNGTLLWRPPRPRLATVFTWRNFFPCFERIINRQNTGEDGYGNLRGLEFTGSETGAINLVSFGEYSENFAAACISRKWAI